MESASFRRRGRRRNRNELPALDRIYDGQPYAFDGKVGRDGRSLICAYRNRWRCSGRGVLYGQIFRETHEHNHPRNFTQEETDIFLHELCVCCTRQFRNLNDIYDRMEDLHPEAAATLDYEAVRERMKRWRNSMDLPSINESYATLYEKLSNDYSSLLWCRNGRLEVDLYNAGGLAEVLTLVDDDLLRIIDLETITAIVITSTTSWHTSLLPINDVILVACVSGKHAYPCIIMMLKSRSQQSYDCVANQVRQIFRREDLPVYTNYDEKLHLSLDEFYDNVQGTFYEYTVILSAMMHKFEIDDLENVNTILMRKITALALLPPAKIIETYRKLCCRLTPALKEAMHDFLRYFEKTWLVRVGAENFSVYNDLSRINDIQRSLRKELDKLVNPSIFDILQKAQKDASRQGKYWVPRVRTVVHPVKALKSTWKKFNDGENDEIGVLECASFFLKECMNDVLTFPELLPHDFDVPIGAGVYSRVLREDEFDRVTSAEDTQDILWETNRNARRSTLRRRATQRRLLVTNARRTNSPQPPPENPQNDEEIFEIPEDDYSQFLREERLEVAHHELPTAEEKAAIMEKVRDNLQRNIGGQCAICQSEEATVTFMPCKHKVTCQACHLQLRERSEGNFNCHVCRTLVLNSE
ncbi:uncharacterized protein LOC107044754 isoform X2 [Diachasma alloeum]|uniref:uncharacterized protein LOC107044754 isoform X2 n=1 Tax=Diachasma alloeum TaxID=454923 RepID=UPI0007383A38|nr:uncharacterized protein LOC107044754 isoform X2 [Diachasma alloeum]